MAYRRASARHVLPQLGIEVYYHWSTPLTSAPIKDLSRHQGLILLLTKRRLKLFNRSIDGGIVVCRTEPMGFSPAFQDL